MLMMMLEPLFAIHIKVDPFCGFFRVNGQCWRRPAMFSGKLDAK